MLKKLVGIADTEEYKRWLRAIRAAVKDAEPQKLIAGQVRLDPRSKSAACAAVKPKRVGLRARV